MEIKTTKIDGVKLLVPNVFGDDRGYFFESYNQNQLNKIVGRSISFVQDNQSKSSYGVFRGFAYQADPFTQSKLVRVIEGEVLDVVLDIRKDSSTFGKYTAHKLSAENKHQLFLPRGVAHAFLTLSSSATVNYKVDNYFNPESERGIHYADKTIGVDWPIPLSDMKVSEKDNSRPNWEQAEYFERGEDLYD